MNKSRFTNLDFIKVIIATLIVFHHYQYLSGIKFNHINFYGGRIYYGYLVELFFMISGFLMQKSYEHKEINKDISNVYNINDIYDNRYGNHRRDEILVCSNDYKFIID